MAFEAPVNVGNRVGEGEFEEWPAWEIFIVLAGIFQSMVADKDQTEYLSGLFEGIFAPNYFSPFVTNWNMDLYSEALLDEVPQVLSKNGAPRFYLIGRSGSGKSSLINAIANGQVAEVGDIKPTTTESDVYEVEIPELNTQWELVDSRGLFESVPAGDSRLVDGIEPLKNDISYHHPDLLLHIVTPDQARAGADDFNAIERLNELIEGGLPPRIICLNKVDTFHSPGDDWPPAEGTTLSKNIDSALKMIAEVFSVPHPTAFDYGSPWRGLTFYSSGFIGAFPTYAQQEPFWNISTLIEALYTYQPEKKQLEDSLKNRHEQQMRKLAQKQTTAVVKKISQLSRESNYELENSVVASLQLYLIALIGSFSGETLGPEPVKQYFSAWEPIGELPAELDPLIDSGSNFKFQSGRVDSLSVARLETYCIGRSAESYFFDNAMVAPAEFTVDVIQ